jgi:peptidoglycan/LPS O-acetylase OafA/YrhL
MGKASYAMFILHIPLLWWAVSWGFPYAPEAYVAMVLLVAAIVFRWFEEPANAYLRDRLGSGERRIGPQMNADKRR